MPATMLLPEDADDTAIAYDLPKKLAPYARLYYEERKKVDETIDEFACRMLCEDSVRFVMQTKLGEGKEQRTTEAVEDHAALSLEHTNLLKG